MSNEKQQQPNIIPDAPIMRSMMVAPAVPTIPRRVAAPLAKQALHSSASAATTKRATLSWNLEETAVLPLPSIYMLERTHTTVNGSPAEIAKRIAECLRQESVQATYKSQEVSHTIESWNVWDQRSVSYFC